MSGDGTTSYSSTSRKKTQGGKSFRSVLISHHVVDDKSVESFVVVLGGRKVFVDSLVTCLLAFSYARVGMSRSRSQSFLRVRIDSV